METILPAQKMRIPKEIVIKAIIGKTEALDVFLLFRDRDSIERVYGISKFREGDSFITMNYDPTLCFAIRLKKNGEWLVDERIAIDRRIFNRLDIFRDIHEMAG